MQEQTTYDEAKKRFIPEENREITSDSLQSAYDTDATFREKGGQKHSGYTLTVTETCSKENQVQMITDFSLDPNNKGDARILQERMETIKKTLSEINKIINRQ